MEYFIYNNTDYTVSAPDVHYVREMEEANGGSIGITKVLKIGPKSWGTTRRCIQEEVEASVSGGMLYSSSKKGNILICTKEEYEEKNREQASDRLETSIGIHNQEKEVSQSFGFLNKVVKKTDTLNINDFLIGSDDIVEEVEEEPVTVNKNSRLDDLENKMALMMESINNLAKIVSGNNKPVKKKVVKKPTKVEKKKNVQNRKRK